MHSVFLTQISGPATAGARVVTVEAKALPTEKWPLWAKAMALMKKKEDEGVGDTVHRVIGHPASEAFQKWYLRMFGKSCGCARRHREWNSKYPYAADKTE